MCHVYVSSPEHKTHPGPWGPAQWHPREPAISPCPTDLPLNKPQEWLDRALDNQCCYWRRDADGNPLYLYWFDLGTDRFYMVQRNQRAGVVGTEWTYKGYPVEDSDVPMHIADEMHAARLISDEVRLRLRRARRKKFGAKR